MRLCRGGGSLQGPYIGSATALEGIAREVLCSGGGGLQCLRVYSAGEGRVCVGMKSRRSKSFLNGSSRIRDPTLENDPRFVRGYSECTGLIHVYVGSNGVLSRFLGRLKMRTGLGYSCGFTRLDCLYPKP